MADAPDFELLLPTELNVVAFRYRPPAAGDDGEHLDALNARVADALTGSMGAYLGSSARISGRVGFRPVLLNWRTTAEDVDAVLPTIREAAMRY